jgi:hypothetical protein
MAGGFPYAPTLLALNDLYDAIMRDTLELGDARKGPAALA